MLQGGQRWTGERRALWTVPLFLASSDIYPRRMARLDDVPQDHHASGITRSSFFRSLSGRRRWIFVASVVVFGAIITVGTVLALDAPSPEGTGVAGAPSAGVAAEPSPSPSPTQKPVELLDDGVVAVRPKRVRPGDTMTVSIKDPPGAYGLAWFLYRQDGSESTYIGGFRAGPPGQWKDHEFNRFYFLPRWSNVGIESIAFNGNDSIDLKVPPLEPGTYRISHAFLVKREREWHIDVFEVIEP